MRDFLELVVPWAVTTTLLFAYLGHDEARAKGDRAARSWPGSSRMSAVVVFGILSLPIHFWRTRRSFVGVLIGVGAAIAVTVIELGVEAAIDALPPLELQPDGPTSTGIAFLLELALFLAAYGVVRRVASIGPAASARTHQGT